MMLMACGTFLTAWGHPSRDGYFSGVAVDGSGNVFVADPARIQKFACPP